MRLSAVPNVNVVIKYGELSGTIVYPPAWSDTIVFPAGFFDLAVLDLLSLLTSLHDCFSAFEARNCMGFSLTLK